MVNWFHPFLLKYKVSAIKADNPIWLQANIGTFTNEYWKASYKDIKTLKVTEDWKVVDRTEGINIINSIWDFKLKWFPDGSVKKFKVLSCAHGYQKLEGIDFFETYASVVQWNTVYIFITLEVFLYLK